MKNVGLTVGPDLASDVQVGDAYDLVARLPHNSVDLLLTSPPYWGHRTYGLDHNWEILREWLDS